jgi:hypothetical protein
MYFELQLSGDVFGRIVRNRLKALPLCPDREFVDDDGKLTGVPGTLVVVDRVEIGENTSIQREQIQQPGGGPQTFADGATQVTWIFSPTNYTSFTVPFLQVKQEIKIHLVKATELEVNGPNATTPFRTFPVYVVFNVALRASNQTQGGGPLIMSYSFAHIDYGILYLFLSSQQRKDIEQDVAAIQLPPTTLDLGPLSAMLHRPVSGINAGIVCDASNAFVALRVDFDVYNSPIAVTPQFFTESPESLLDGNDWAMLVDRDALVADAHAKAKKALESDSKIRLNSGPYVSWNPSQPAVDIQADVELVDACPFFIDDMDMDVDVQIGIQMSVPTPNTVRTHFHLEGSPSNVGEEIACAVTGALLWPFIGPLFLKDEDIGVGLGAYFGGLAVHPAIRFIGLIAVIETQKLSKDISDKLGDSCKKLDDENYECNEVVQAIMQLTPAFNSRLEVERLAGSQRGLVFGGSISNLRDLFMGSLEPMNVCPFKWQVLGRCAGNGKSNFRIGNEGSIHVFGTPPAALCNARVLYDPEYEFVLTVTDGVVTIVPQFKPSYVANPYPCRVRVITNRGVRTITLAPPVAKTAREAEELEKARLRAHASCYYWEKVFTPVEKIKWLPDPPVDRERFVQFWQIAVRGMQPDESIHVRSHDDMPLLVANPSRAGLAHFALLFTADRAQPELELELRGQREKGEEEREVSLQQLLFEYRASLPIGAAVRSMRFESGANNRRLVVVQDDSEITWDVSTPVAPALLQSVRRHDVEKESRQHVVLHTGKSIGAAPSANLLRALGRLVQGHGVAEIVGSPRLGGAKETLYVRSKDGTILFDITNPDEPRAMHVYQQPAWFEDVAMGGKMLARYDARTEMIDIYVAALSKECA